MIMWTHSRGACIDQSSRGSPVSLGLPSHAVSTSGIFHWVGRPDVAMKESSMFALSISVNAYARVHLGVTSSCWEVSYWRSPGLYSQLPLHVARTCSNRHSSSCTPAAEALRWTTCPLFVATVDERYQLRRWCAWVVRKGVLITNALHERMLPNPGKQDVSSTDIAAKTLYYITLHGYRRLTASPSSSGLRKAHRFASWQHAAYIETSSEKVLARGLRSQMDPG